MQHKCHPQLAFVFTSLASFLAASCVLAASAGLTSIDTGLTICKVRTAVNREASYIVASSYEGTVLGISYQGRIGWKNQLSGFMNRDLCCEDLNGDGSAEIMVANADGTLYCLDGMGKLLWRFQPSEAPMNAVCVVRSRGEPYVVCGGYDKNLYYLTAEGELVKTIASSTYSQEKPWGKPGEKRYPNGRAHIANFLRTIRGPGGRELLAVHGIMNSNTTTGSVYLFEPLADLPTRVLPKLAGSKPYGDLSVSDLNGDGVDEILLGTSTMIQDSHVVWFDGQNDRSASLDLIDLRGRVDGFGYRVAQPLVISDQGQTRLLIAFGAQFVVSPPSFDMGQMEILDCGYSFNDIWKDPVDGRIVLASTQSGGSCIHVIDPSQPQWKQAIRDFQPMGKLKTILENTSAAREQLQHFKAPEYERDPKPVYMMTESLSGDVERLAFRLEAEYGSPVFLSGGHTSAAEDWDRSSVGSEQYRDRRDRRRKYTLTQQQALEEILPWYEEDRRGAAFWGGHGNDPYMFSTDTILKIADAAAANDKMTVFIYPELEHYDDDFALVVKQHFYPMAARFQGENQYIYVRTKHAFWQSIVYMPLWSRLLSGEFSNVFIPSMEETTDKTMEQSVAGRVGIWASGAVDQWGSRCARDNASFDRLRQHAHQTVPNHFLRAQIYHVANGATFLNNFPIDQQYFSILYELIAKGALYVPDPDEIVSFSPVHLSMTEPDETYLDEGNNAKWLTFYDAEFERENPLVFSRLNGTWPGAPVAEWDFSKYAAGIADRRLNFLPPYEHGLVLITPPQHGVYADIDAPRGQLSDHLHPLYRNILKEYITDGRDYLSPDGFERFAANEYYRRVEADIRAGAKQLPLTVSGDVAWVCAQTAPKHLRLTLIDSGYLNPQARKARIDFHTVRPVKAADLLSGESLDVANVESVQIDVPCGLFRFIDIELQRPLPGDEKSSDNSDTRILPS